MAIGYSPFVSSQQATLGTPDIGTALRSGYENYQKFHEAQNTPKKLAEALYSQQLQNKINEAKSKYAMQNEAAGLAHTQAGTGLLGQQTLNAKILNQFLPESERARIDKLKASPALTGKLGQLFTLRQNFPEGTHERKWVDQAIQNAAAGSQGTQLSVDPATGAVNFSQGGSRSGPQSQIITDAEGNQTVVSKPTTPVVTGQEKLSLANEARQYVSENLEQPYIGTGSNISLGMDRYNYNNEKNPESKKAIGDRLVKAAVAAKMAPEYASLQLSAQGVQPTVSSLREQEKSIKQGWAEGLPTIVNNLPVDLQKRVQKEHAKELQKLKEIREQHFAKGFPIKITPTDQKDLSKLSDEELARIARGVK